MNRPSYIGKCVMVTGGAGFIGSHLVERLLSDGAAKVIIVDNLFLGSLSNIDSSLKRGAIFYNEDIEDKTALAKIFDENEIEVVFNLATKPLNYSFINPSDTFLTNVNGIINLLELQRAGKFASLCHFSTSEVYGTAIYEPMDEAHPKTPTTSYAAGKTAADLALESYVRMYSLDAFIVRPFNNYGPRQNYDGLLAGVIPKTVSRILAGLAPEIHGTGAQRRDFVFVDDTVDAVAKVFSILPKGEAVNISGNNIYTIRNLIFSIADYMGYKGEILSIESRSADVQAHYASNAKLKSLTPFNTTPFDVGMIRTLDWYSERFAEKYDA